MFGSLKKLAGKVLKTGLSVATRGVSDKVLGAMKGLGKKRSTVQLKPMEMTEQEYALATKLGQATPKVRVSEVYADARAGGAMPGTYKRKGSYKRKRRAMSYDEAPAVAPRKRKKAGAPRAKRGAPPGGLDLRAMAQAWRSAGKPTTWQGWIKTNPIRRPR